MVDGAINNTADVQQKQGNASLSRQSRPSRPPDARLTGSVSQHLDYYKRHKALVWFSVDAIILQTGEGDSDALDTRNEEPQGGQSRCPGG